MEDWQEWQIRADRVASELAAVIDGLQRDSFEEDKTFNGRHFWPRFRELKERVRLAPAIRLEAKLDLERRLRVLGARAYKFQEVANASSNRRREELLEKIREVLSKAESESSAVALRMLRRDFDTVREEFDSGDALVPPDRQAVWDAWREANQFAWKKLVELWTANETELRGILMSAREQLERGNAAAARQALPKFFDMLKNREIKQDVVVAMKSEVGAIRRAIDEAEQSTASARAATRQPATPSTPAAPPSDAWRSDLAQNESNAARLRSEIAALDQQLQETKSILDQAVLRGTLVDKRRKLAEQERSCRALSQKIEQSEETPLMRIG